MQAYFVVMTGSGGNLLGYRTCVDLGVVQFHNNEKIDTIDEEKNIWYKEFPNVFSGKIGN